MEIKQQGYMTDNDGVPSSMRIAYTFSVVIFMLVWAALCWKQQSFVEVGVGDVSILGVLFGGKIAQKAIEAWNSINKSKLVADLEALKDDGD